MFAAEGAKIIGADFNAQAGQATIDGIVAQGGEATFVQANLRQKEDVEKNQGRCRAEIRHHHHSGQLRRRSGA